jgi:hypothetical protein
MARKAAQEAAASYGGVMSQRHPLISREGTRLLHRPSSTRERRAGTRGDRLDAAGLSRR